MAWCWPGDKPLSEQIMAQFNDVYMYRSGWMSYTRDDIDGSAQNCSNSIVIVLELPQFCTKPLAVYHKAVESIVPCAFVTTYEHLIKTPYCVDVRQLM